MGEGDGVDDCGEMMSDTSWATVVVAALGIIGTGAGTLFGVRLTQHGADRRWNAAQVAFANRAEADRLRRVYSRMVAAANMAQSTIGERNTRFGDETIEERDSRHTRQIKQAVDEVGEVAGEILIEKSATEVADLYNDLVNALGWYLQIDDSPPGLQRTNGLEQRRDEITRLAEEIRVKAQDHVALLDQAPQVSAIKEQG